MKKIFGFIFLLLPVVSFAAPSVRLLGNQPALSAATSSGVKVTPRKASVSDDSLVSNARIGTLHAKPKMNSLSNSSSLNTGSRFPVITPAYSYSSVSTPKTAGAVNQPNPTTSNADVSAIVDALTRDYYTKNEIDAKFDDSRFDAIRLTDPYVARGNVAAPNGYIYVWVEEN